MLPLSLSRPRAVSTDQKDLPGAFGWEPKPVNVNVARNAEFRALISWLALFVSVGVAIGVGHVWLRLKVVDVGYRLSAVRQAIEKLQNEERELTLTIAGLEVPGRLEETAHRRLGMVRPERGQEAVLP